MVPIEGGRFAAFGRVFSGTVRSGERVRILGSNYRYGENRMQAKGAVASRALWHPSAKLFSDGRLLWRLRPLMIHY